MVPITKDGYIVFHKNVAVISEAISGPGLRAPGCTLINTDLTGNIIREMKEEFNVDVTKKDILFYGLTESRPPLSYFHHTLIGKVTTKLNRDELTELWSAAKDRYEGELEFIKIDYENKSYFKENTSAIGPNSEIILNTILEKDFLIREVLS